MFTNRLFNMLVVVTLLVPIAIRGIGLAVLAQAEAKGNFITTSGGSMV